MQIQIDPNVPTAIPPEQMRDFKSFLDTVLAGIIGPAAQPLLDTGNALWTGMAVIVVVWTGARIAFSGNIQPWELVRLVIGLWVPWVMLQFYSTPLPGMAWSFPGAVAAGGTWLQNFFIADTAYAMQTELGNLVHHLWADFETSYSQGSILNVITTGGHGTLTLFAGAAIMAFVVICLALLFCVTYAQVIWAQVAISILILLGPIFIPWLVFDPLAFLFWGWFRALIIYALYGAIAGVVMRVFAGIGLGYVTTLANTSLNWSSISDLALWCLAVIPLFVAGLLASLKVGELASMLVTSGGASSSGLMSAGMMAATGGKAAVATAGVGVLKK